MSVFTNPSIQISTPYDFKNNMASFGSLGPFSTSMIFFL